MSELLVTRVRQLLANVANDAVNINAIAEQIHTELPAFPIEQIARTLKEEMVRLRGAEWDASRDA